MVEDILRQPRRQVFRHVIAVVGVGAGLAAFARHTPASVRTGQVRREVQIEEVIPEWRAVRGLGRGAGTNCEDIVRAVQLSASLALSTLASVLVFTPWRMVEAELYSHAQPPTAN